MLIWKYYPMRSTLYLNNHFRGSMGAQDYLLQLVLFQQQKLQGLMQAAPQLF